MFFLYKSGKIHYSDTGIGDVVVLLHGYLESSEVWKGFAEKLSSQFRVISMDLPGHGASDIYEDEHTMEFIATAVKELLAELGIAKVFLVGHSLGGYVALAFLDLFPGNLSGYCLFHSQPFPDTPEALENRRREIAIVRAGKKELMYPDNVTRMFASVNLEKLSGALQRSKDIASQISREGIIAVLNGMMIRPSRLSVMEKGTVPCLWILGAMDNYIPCELIKDKVHLPVNARVVILKKSGHMGFIEEENKAVQVITAFIQKLKSLETNY